MSTDDKAELLVDYLEREGRAAPWKTIIGHLQIGDFWDSFTGPHKRNKAAVDAVLARRPKANEVYQRALSLKKKRNPNSSIVAFVSKRVNRRTHRTDLANSPNILPHLRRRPARLTQLSYFA